jgi:hypothetical protein
MCTMVSLHADILGMIVTYMDHPSLATMAQTCKAWRHIVYRTSLWQTWRPKPRAIEYFYTDMSIPKHSHHCGEPTRLCFFSWATHILKHDILSNVPRTILTIEDSVKFVDTLYLFWAANRRPCIHTNHYKWSHVFKGRAVLKTLEPSEIERIGYRTTEFPTSSSDSNPYRFWLTSYINSVLPIRTGVPPMPTDSTDILAMLYYKLKKIEHERFAEIGRRQEYYILKFLHSIRALAPLSNVEFTHNEKAFQSNPAAFFSAIEFTLVVDNSNSYYMKN